MAEYLCRPSHPSVFALAQIGGTQRALVLASGKAAWTAALPHPRLAKP